MALSAVTLWGALAAAPQAHAGAGAASAAPAAHELVAAQLIAELHADAMQAFGERRYADAYGRFARLGDVGHVPSATMALMMLREGPTMFRSAWGATAAQQRRWQALAFGTREIREGRFRHVDTHSGE